MAEGLAEGAVFPSWDAFEAVLKKYCEEGNYLFMKKSAKKIEAHNSKIKKVDNHFPLSWKYKSIYTLCKHYGTYESKSTGARTTGSFKTGCSAHVRLNANKSKGGLVITSINLNHSNHPQLSKEEAEKLYPETKKLSEAELQEMTTLLDLKVKPAIICKYFREKHGLHLADWDIHNHKRRLSAALQRRRSEDNGSFESMEDSTTSDPGAAVDSEMLNDRVTPDYLHKVSGTPGVIKAKGKKSAAALNKSQVDWIKKEVCNSETTEPESCTSNSVSTNASAEQRLTLASDDRILTNHDDSPTDASDDDTSTDTSDDHKPSSTLHRHNTPVTDSNDNVPSSSQERPHHSHRKSMSEGKGKKGSEDLAMVDLGCVSKLMNEAFTQHGTTSPGCASHWKFERVVMTVMKCTKCNFQTEPRRLTEDDNLEPFLKCCQGTY